jgi:hypothetical protein
VASIRGRQKKSFFHGYAIAQIARSAAARMAYVLATIPEIRGRSKPFEKKSMKDPAGVSSSEILIQARKDGYMLYTIAVVLVVLWLFGIVTAYTMGGFIHVLLVIAIVVVLLRVISGRSPV